MSPLFSPVSAGGTPKATVTATTGAPTIDTTSRPGKTIYKFTGSGSITVGVSGTCEALIIGGGSYNGAGGYVYRQNVVLASGTLGVTIGAGTVIPTNSTAGLSQLGDLIVFGGGPITYYGQSGAVILQGGSQGGLTGTGTAIQPLFNGLQGSAGGIGFAGSPVAAVGGGGGAGGVGGNASSATVGGNGGPGATNSITGTAVTYAAGGGGSPNGTPAGNGAANTGNGAGYNSTGGSGFVVVVIG